MLRRHILRHRLGRVPPIHPKQHLIQRRRHRCGNARNDAAFARLTDGQRLRAFTHPLLAHQQDRPEPRQQPLHSIQCAIKRRESITLELQVARRRTERVRRPRRRGPDAHCALLSKLVTNAVGSAVRCIPCLYSVFSR